ncbi:hypothetical protein [Caballeronia fortuita]|uniref:hypothetical protein n=1 Tax=Caballeronia fortuita TaxID=1777138 RepID=UPI001FCA3E21|nr:hypothetical protein [Caballeronia fortuita]
MVTSIGFEGEGLALPVEFPPEGALAPDGVLALAGALAPFAPLAGAAPDAAAGPDADDAPPDAAGSELELPPLHPPMTAAMATAIAPTDMCPFICESPIRSSRPRCLPIIVCGGLTRGAFVCGKLAFGGTVG